MNNRDASAPAAGKPPAGDLESLARRYGIDLVTALPADALDPELVREVPVEWARANAVLPVRLGGAVVLLTAEPGEMGRQEYVSLLLGASVRPALAPRELILSSIERCYFSRRDTPDEFLRDIRAGAAAETGEALRSDDLLRVAREAPVTQLANLILLEAVKRGASDIHFEPFESRLRVRYRVDGVLYEQSSPPKHMEDALISRLKVMARLDISERRLPQDGMAKVRVGEREIDIRVSTVPVAEGERVVLRLLDRKSALLPLTSLGMSEATLAEFRGFLAQPNGIVVVSGPTGSGKTTTLYAALSYLDSSRRNIMTIEDPIEYQLPDIGQIQVKPKIGLTFASGLRHILRQDPDIVLVGETRDLETAEIAVRASLTGHLVFTTLHTNDAPGAVVRLLDMGIEPYLLASCLRGVLAQRLVRQLCPVCRRKVVLAAADVSDLGAKGRALIGRDAFMPVGCDRCLEGYRGRCGVFELFGVDAEAQRLVRTSPGAADELRTRIEARGIRTLLDDCLDKVLQGVTSLPEVVGVVSV